MEPDLRAEARRMLEDRQSREIHCHIIGAHAPYDQCTCERCKRGIPFGPNDWTVTIVHVGGDSDTDSYSPPRSESEVRDTRASGEKQSPVARAAPQEHGPEAITP
jgi:hypothetical protein